jgi:3-deoxy-D-arabino-heptulosonate 7-phosphate (DAHP) synthase class II
MGMWQAGKEIVFLKNMMHGKKIETAISPLTRHVASVASSP